MPISGKDVAQDSHCAFFNQDALFLVNQKYTGLEAFGEGG